MIIKRPTVISKQTLVSLLVITLTTVIAARAGSVSDQDKSPVVGGSGSDSLPAVAAEVIPKVGDVKDPAKANVDPGIDSSTLSAKSLPADSKAVQVADQQPEAMSAVQSQVAPATEEKPAASADAASAAEANSEAGRRKGRAEQSSSSPAPAAAAEAAKPAAPAAEKAVAVAEKPAAAEKVKLEPKAGLAKPGKPQSLSGKAGAKSKLPANLGTVTSTGSGGPAHYMSKHDAYSAIAEKHGALAQDAMRKSDKRSQIQSFGGIQKASGLGDMFSPFKGVGDSGLARTLGASVRSIMKSKYSVPAYVASALLGAVALLAFYESPISPLPVPPLPEPPVGRFPPEMPNLSPNIQVPFRTNQQQQQYGQQNYNQRSFNGPAQQQQLGNLFQQQPQQHVLFPAASANGQQRQMGPAGSSVAGAGPVQQLAANLLSSVGKPQISQRKSGPDYESISRSLFGAASSMAASPKMGAPANQQKANSFLGFFGLGGGSSSAPSASTAPTSGELQQASNAAAAAAPAAPISPQLAASDLKNSLGATANGLSNSHLVNKVKSYFSRASPVAPATSSSSSSISAATNSNPYDQYQRMSFVQALMKDTAFLPAFLSPTRKSSSSGSSQSSATNKQSTLSGNNGPAARMQVDGIQSLAGNQNQLQPASSKQKPASSSYGLVRTADRIAHALLETFTSGIAQRNAQPVKSNEDSQGNQVASLATSLISDLVSGYSANANPIVTDQSQQSQAEQQQAKSAQQQQQTSQQSDSSQGASARSASDADEDHGANSNVAASHSNNKQQQQQQQQVAPSSTQLSPNQDQGSSSSSSAGHVRKTRSIGFEYPVESNQELALREQQPSKAAQINSVIDFVADSYTNNRLLFNFVMNQVGLSQAVPYVEQILASGGGDQQ